MNIQVFRVRFYKTHTIGQLYINNVFFCFTLEDVVREVTGQPVEKWKIPHETAIPVGSYSLTLEQSPRFGVDTITINRVPGYTGVRIHAGNTDKDTDGCIIVGYKLDDNNNVQFGTTRPALADLKGNVKHAILNNQKVSIDIRTMR